MRSRHPASFNSKRDIAAGQPALAGGAILRNAPGQESGHSKQRKKKAPEGA
jgi:hypothetical protein